MKVFATFLVLSTAVTIAALPASAEDKNLPGVVKPDPIVSAPPPEPLENGKDPPSFRIGNTDVRISGEITIDVIMGDIKPSPHR